MLGRLASVVICALALSVTGSVTAQAATRAFADGAGDVWTLGQSPNSRVPDREQGDILRTRLQHGRQQIVVRHKFAELNRVGRQIFIFTQLRTNTGLVSVVSLTATPRQATNGWRGRIEFERRDGQTVGCRITRGIDYASNVAVVRIPRSCLDDPRTVQAKFGVATVDEQAFADNPINRRDTQTLPPYTQPVRAGQL